MATKLFLRDTVANGINGYKDMLIAAGAASTTGVVNTTASGTEIQWTQTAGGVVLEFISGRVPAGGFTLSGTMTFSIWAHESNMNANCGARSRVFKRTAAGVTTEVGGGPYNDGVEFGTAAAEMVWTGTPTSTAFAENDRIIVRYYITNVGTMASGHTCTLTYNTADATTGDSFFQINENVTFKGEPATVAITAATMNEAGVAVNVNAKTFKVAGLATEAYGGQAATATNTTVIAAAVATLSNTGQSIVTNAKKLITASAASMTNTGQAIAALLTQYKTVTFGVLQNIGRVVSVTNSSPFIPSILFGISGFIENMINKLGLIFIIEDDPTYWKTLADGLESYALFTTPAGDCLPGYHLRCARAYDAIAGTNNEFYNDCKTGYLEQLLAAMEAHAAQSYAGSTEHRLRQASEDVPL